MPTQVSIAVKDEFGLDAPRLPVATYDPEKYVGRQLSGRWKPIPRGVVAASCLTGLPACERSQTGTDPSPSIS